MYFVKLTLFLYVLSEYHGTFKIFKWNADKQKYSSNENFKKYIVSWNVVLIGHALRPP